MSLYDAEFDNLKDPEQRRGLARFGIDLGKVVQPVKENVSRLGASLKSLAGGVVNSYSQTPWGQIIGYMNKSNMENANQFANANQDFIENPRNPEVQKQLINQTAPMFMGMVSPIKSIGRVPESAWKDYNALLREQDKFKAFISRETDPARLELLKNHLRNINGRIAMFGKQYISKAELPLADYVE